MQMSFARDSSTERNIDVSGPFCQPKSPGLAIALSDVINEVCLLGTFNLKIEVEPCARNFHKTLAQ